MTPTRHQRSRRAGAKQPPGTIYVGRPTRWGNPHPWQAAGRAAAVERYAADLAAMPTALRDALLAPLRGAPALSCWCPADQPCHIDVLLAWLRGDV